MASYKKRGDKWQVRISFTNENGKSDRLNKGGFLTKKAAQLFAVETEQKINDGWQPKVVTYSHIFADYFNQWYLDFKEAKLSARTKQRYLITQRELSKYFKDKSIEDITRRDYQKFINEYGSTHAKNTVHKVNSLVNACVKNAIYEDVIVKNFCDGIQLVFDPTKTRKIEYLNIKEMNDLASNCYNHINKNFTSNQMIITAIFTGARLGEIQGLRWQDINFNFKTISINHAFNESTREIIPTKNESSVRIIRVGGELIELFKTMKQNKHNEFIFTTQDKTVPTSGAVNKVLKQRLEELGIHRQGFHFHSLRHTHVAYLLAENMDLYAISKRLGHSDLSTTTRIYSYLIEEHRAKTDNQIEISLNKIKLLKNLG